jgi:hypothetical protein
MARCAPFCPAFAPQVHTGNEGENVAAVHVAAWQQLPALFLFASTNLLTPCSHTRALPARALALHRRNQNALSRSFVHIFAPIDLLLTNNAARSNLAPAPSLLKIGRHTVAASSTLWQRA